MGIVPTIRVPNNYIFGTLIDLKFHFLNYLAAVLAVTPSAPEFFLVLTNIKSTLFDCRITLWSVNHHAISDTHTYMMDFPFSAVARKEK